MEVTLSVDLSLEENAGQYFDKAKKAKSKLSGAQEALQASLVKLTKLEQENQKKEALAPTKKQEGPKKWYHKFRWFRTSEGYLAVGGRDATTNDLIVKKHTDPGDLVFHTERPGSPFFVLKAKAGGDGRDVDGKFDQLSKEQVAKATATFSKAWARQITADEVYCVSPDQLKKEMGLPKGTFMVYGKREFFTASVNLCVGLTKEGEVMAGPPGAISTHCPTYFVVVQGNEKVSAIAKKINKHFGVDLDTIIRVFPGGTFKLDRMVKEGTQ